MYAHPEPYARKPLCRDRKGEVLVATWRAGARCAPHDHGGAHGVVIVVRGSLLETVWENGPDGLRPIAARSLSAGDARVVEPGLIHDMQAQDAAVTLHGYLPAIQGMRVFDVDRQQRLRVRDNCGAWVPTNSDLILERCHWPIYPTGKVP